ncbi:MAG: amidase family protein [Burkholderiaceae bacterium]
MTELWRWPATRLARAIRTRAISSREAVQSCLDRTAAVNPRLNAIVEVLTESALSDADAADEAVRRGDALGPLHGVPVTTKINVDQRGLATTNGLVAQRANIASEDSPVVANLRKAGAVIFGRTNTPAFSMRWFTDNALHGRTLNPWSAGHTPGGSSGGASSAVAAGMGPIAHGNDLAGSVRYPAYCTGVYGLRPSFGRVPAFLPSAPAERPISPQLMSVQGPLARTVADVRVALQAMSAGDPRDPWWVPAPLTGAPPGRPIRIAMSFDAGALAPHPEIVVAIRRAGAWLAEAGYRVEEVEPPGIGEAAMLWDLLSRNDNLSIMKPLVAAHGDDAIRTSFGHQFDGQPLLDADACLAALVRRTTMIRDWTLFLERYPLVLGPVSADPPFAQTMDTDSRESSQRALRAQGPQFAVPVLGLPAMAIPIGRAGDVPLGVQLIGQRFREDILLTAAEVIESRAPSATPIDPR